MCCYGFSQGRKSLYNTAVYVMKDFVFLQNQVIYTNLLIWTKAFIFLRDPVICTIQLCEIKAFLFLQDPVTCIILLYQTKLFFSWQVPFVHSFFFLFACISSFPRDLCLAITLCLPGFEKLVEQHINLIRYSTSLLWIFFI